MYREAIYNEISKKGERKKSQAKNLNLKNLAKQISKTKEKEQPSLGNKSTKTSEVKKISFNFKNQKKKRKISKDEKIKKKKVSSKKRRESR